MQWLLNKWDKASMASSVEIRSPFLDWRFFQYALALPAELKTKNGQNKSILRDTFGKMLPKSVMEKKFKQGLPIVDFRKDKIAINLIKEAIIMAFTALIFIFYYFSLSLGNNSTKLQGL